MRTFSSAILFAVLSLKSFRLKAKEHGLIDVIGFLKERSPPDSLKQLEYLENLLMLGDEEQDQEEEDVESDCDVDDITD